jgi:hypothetical protein
MIFLPCYIPPQIPLVLYSSDKFICAKLSGIFGILSVLLLEYEEFREFADLIVLTAIGFIICRGYITSLYASRSGILWHA